MHEKFRVESFSANECPVSQITPASKQLVQLFSRAEFAHQASGAALYGPDLSRWPARMVDAQVALQQEENRTANARIESENEAMKRGH